MATPDETRDALIEALVRLIRTQPLPQISVRDIAREAGVNHGLIHRHFGSKDALVAATTARITAEIHGGPLPGHGIAVSTFRYLRDRPELVRVLAHACIDGRTDLLEAAAPGPDHLRGIVDRVQRGLDDLGLANPPDPHVLNATAIATILGWLLFRPLLGSGYGVPPEADDHFEALLALMDLAMTDDVP